MLVQMHYHLEMKFLHSADWQLGKPFGRFEADVRAALTEARFDVIDTLGKAAADHGVQHILVAGDTGAASGKARLGSRDHPFAVCGAGSRLDLPAAYFPDTGFHRVCSDSACNCTQNHPRLTQQRPA